MFWRAILIGAACALAAQGARASECPGNPGALGTSRVMIVDPLEYPRVGTVQYSASLPLQDKEVVLTFDDGPMPPYTNRVLEVLGEQCVKANYFIIGRMARGYPELLRQIRAAGHVIGTHSQNHPLAFERMPLPAVQGEIEQGIASVTSALGERHGVAPFFRIPGLLRAPHVERYLQARGLMTWSADVVADDWKHLSAAEVVRRAIARLDEKGKGILLLHDIQPATALALPELLRQLKTHGYRIVQAVPGKRPAPVPAPVAAAPAPSPQAAAALAQRLAADAGVPLPAAPTDAESAAPPAPDQDSPPNGGADTLAERAAREPPPAANEPDERDTEPAPAEQAATEDASEAIASARAPEPALAPPPPEPIVPGEPVRPFAPGLKPSRSVATPGKRAALEPDGWPPRVNVPVPRAGGVGASAIVRTSETPDGRFQDRR